MANQQTFGYGEQLNMFPSISRSILLWRGQRLQPYWMERYGSPGFATDHNQHDQQDRTRLRIAKENLTVGTWNVRTMSATGQLELLRNEMKRYKWDILGLAKMRWTGMGERNGREVISSGEEEEEEEEEDHRIGI